MNNKNYKIPNYILASKTVRFYNLIIDLVIMRIIMTTIIVSNDLIFQNSKAELSNKMDSLDQMDTYIFWAIVAFFYYTITELFLSKSLAKYFTKTIVVSENGQKPKPINIIARSALRQVPFEYFTFLQGRNLGLHDVSSNTYVVKTEKLKQSLKDFNEFK